MRKYPFYLILATGLITLGACGKPVPLTSAEDQRIDQAMARVKAEQDRTDRVERQKRTTAAELHRQNSVDATPITRIPVHPIQQDNRWQKSPPADVK